jgi:hypothetical protein
LTFLLIINPVISFSLNDGQWNKRNETKKKKGPFSHADVSIDESNRNTKFSTKKIEVKTHDTLEKQKRQTALTKKSKRVLLLILKWLIY